MHQNTSKVMLTTTMSKVPHMHSMLNSVLIPKFRSFSHYNQLYRHILQQMTKRSKMSHILLGPQLGSFLATLNYPQMTPDTTRSKIAPFHVL